MTALKPPPVQFPPPAERLSSDARIRMAMERRDEAERVRIRERARVSHAAHERSFHSSVG